MHVASDGSKQKFNSKTYQYQSIVISWNVLEHIIIDMSSPPPTSESGCITSWQLSEASVTPLSSISCNSCRMLHFSASLLPFPFSPGTSRTTSDKSLFQTTGEIRLRPVMRLGSKSYLSDFQCSLPIYRILYWVAELLFSFFHARPIPSDKNRCFFARCPLGFTRVRMFWDFKTLSIQVSV